MRVVFLILDAFPNNYVTKQHAPTLCREIERGGWHRAGGLAVLSSNTYPNHASFATGAMPASHGIITNHVWTGTEFVHSSTVGPAVPTLFDVLKPTPFRSAIIAGDQEIVATMGGDRADYHWPPAGKLPSGTPVDGFGYAADSAVIDAIDDCDALDADLVVLHLNEPDTSLHLYGPDSEEARAQYLRSDESASAIIDRLQPAWDDTVLFIVSDHTQETIDPHAPIRLDEEYDARGFPGSVCVGGTSAQIVNGPPLERLLELDGVASAEQVTEEIALIYSVPGRVFGRSHGLNGQHGGPRTRAQVAIVSGGHPVVAHLAEQLGRRQPSAIDWAPTILRLLGLDPAEVLPTATGTSLV